MAAIDYTLLSNLPQAYNTGMTNAATALTSRIKLEDVLRARQQQADLAAALQRMPTTRKEFVDVNEPARKSLTGELTGYENAAQMVEYPGEAGDILGAASAVDANLSALPVRREARDVPLSQDQQEYQTWETTRNFYKNIGAVDKVFALDKMAEEREQKGVERAKMLIQSNVPGQRVAEIVKADPFMQRYHGIEFVGKNKDGDYTFSHVDAGGRVLGITLNKKTGTFETKDLGAAEKKGKGGGDGDGGKEEDKDFNSARDHYERIRQALSTGKEVMTDPNNPMVQMTIPISPERRRELQNELRVYEKRLKKISAARGARYLAGEETPPAEKTTGELFLEDVLKANGVLPGGSSTTGRTRVYDPKTRTFK